MKDLNYMNYCMVGIPLLLMLGGWIFNSNIVIMGMLLTVLTGAFQLIAGIGLFIDSGYRDAALGIYLAVVALFFALWIVTDWQWIIALPPALALYLSAIIFTKAKQEKS